jgi:hypothetical protein
MVRTLGDPHDGQSETIEVGSEDDARVREFADGDLPRTGALGDGEKSVLGLGDAGCGGEICGGSVAVTEPAEQGGGTVIGISRRDGLKNRSITYAKAQTIV